MEKRGKQMGGSLTETKEYTLYEMSDIIERIAAVGVTNTATDYGTGEKYNPVEVHTLSHIAEHPGISVTELARDWAKTKGAVSQMIRKLETRGLIVKKKMIGNDKVTCLYVTEEGAELDKMHRTYDTRNYKRFLELLDGRVTHEELMTTFKVLENWIELSLDWIPY